MIARKLAMEVGNKVNWLNSGVEKGSVDDDYALIASSNSFVTASKTHGMDDIQ